MCIRDRRHTVPGKADTPVQDPSVLRQPAFPVRGVLIGQYCLDSGQGFCFLDVYKRQVQGLPHGIRITVIPAPHILADVAANGPNGADQG